MPPHAELPGWSSPAWSSPAWSSLDVAPGIEARIVRAMPALAPALDTVVERHWQAALRRHALFNGQVFSADRYGPERIEGHWTEYRRVVAQMADPGLIPALQVRSLAVCGVLRCADGVVVGRRDAGSVYQPGKWQLPPAGSVDAGAARGGTADLRHALLAELHEELGLDAASVASLRPLCLVQHPSGVLDLGMQIGTPLSGAEVVAAHRARGNGEYADLVVIPLPDLAARLGSLPGGLVPTAHELLRRMA